jgi:Domain of unknown function (DUF4188)
VINRDRMTATMDGPFVVFLIGLRINKPLLVNKWFPVLSAMPRMLNELYAAPELGLLSHESWFGRTTIMVQYWRSMELLLAYAKDRNAEHLPAWAAFNKAVGRNGSVGIWHETYAVQPGSYENIYANMPAFGLGKAGNLQTVTAARDGAAARLKTNA